MIPNLRDVVCGSGIEQSLCKASRDGTRQRFTQSLAAPLETDTQRIPVTLTGLKFELTDQTLASLPTVKQARVKLGSLAFRLAACFRSRRPLPSFVGRLLVMQLSSHVWKCQQPGGKHTRALHAHSNGVSNHPGYSHWCLQGQFVLSSLSIKLDVSIPSEEFILASSQSSIGHRCSTEVVALLNSLGPSVYIIGTCSIRPKPRSTQKLPKLTFRRFFSKLDTDLAASIVAVMRNRASTMAKGNFARVYS